MGGLVKVEVQRWVVVVLGERVGGLECEGAEELGGLEASQRMQAVRGQGCPRHIERHAESDAEWDPERRLELCAAADPSGLKKKRPGWSKSRVKVT